MLLEIVTELRALSWMVSTLLKEFLEVLNGDMRIMFDQFYGNMSLPRIFYLIFWI